MDKNDLEQIKNILKSKGIFRCILKDDNVIIEAPLFTTDDSVNIYKGDDSIVFVHTKALIVEHLNVRNYVGDSTCKYFSTKEAANKWIEENKPRKPVYTDPDNRDEFFEDSKAYYFVKGSYNIRTHKIHEVIGAAEEDNSDSKIYNTWEKCELALAEFIANKNGKILIDKD